MGSTAGVSQFDSGATVRRSVYLGHHDALGAPSMTDDLQTVPVSLRLRQALAFPIYTIALILDYVSAALGSLAARIAGDHWPA
jgi:hypothetical protein